MQNRSQEQKSHSDSNGLFIHKKLNKSKLRFSNYKLSVELIHSRYSVEQYFLAKDFIAFLM